jgi:hypothetical protein
VSIVGRTTPEPPSRPIHYCPSCGRGSTAGPCTHHQASKPATKSGERDPGKQESKTSSGRLMTRSPSCRTPAIVRSSAPSEPRGRMEAQP